MDIDYSTWKFWADMLDKVATAVLFVWMVFSNRHRVTVTKIETLEKDTVKRLDDHNTRMTCLESDIRHVPSRDEIKALGDKVEQTNSLLARVEGRMEGINRAVDLMNEYLINRADKG